MELKPISVSTLVWNIYFVFQTNFFPKYYVIKAGWKEPGFLLYNRMHAIVNIDRHEYATLFDARFRKFVASKESKNITHSVKDCKYTIFAANDLGKFWIFIIDKKNPVIDQKCWQWICTK